jgi:alkylhydroperoxidase/carboxymuconolactone decarboxylase family protein YurZ
MGLTTITEVGVKDRLIVDNWPSTAEQRKGFHEAGLETIKTLYGHKHLRYQDRVRALHPAYGHWCIDFMYGRVRSRPGMDQKTRALCELVALGGQIVHPQFRAGVLMALTAGATLEEIRGVLDMTEEVWGSGRQAMYDALWQDLDLDNISETGWRLPEDPAEREKVMATEGAIDPNTTLRPDFSHLKSVKDIVTPTWRHPLVTTFRNVEGLRDQQRLYALIAANANAGLLSSMRHGWAFLKPSEQRAGLEAVLEIAVFAGHHRLHNALRTLHEEGIADIAVDVEAEDTVDYTKFPENGEAVMSMIYTNTLPGLTKSIQKMHPDIWAWINEWAYGQVLARPNLTVVEREFVALACMVGNATFPQLRSHMRGALNCGATTDEVRGILDQTSTAWGQSTQQYMDGYWMAFVKGHREAKAKKETDLENLPMI